MSTEPGSLLDAIKKAHRPRGPELTQKLAARLDPTWLLAVRGLLAFVFLGALVLVAVGLPVILLLKALGLIDDQRLDLPISVALIALAVALPLRWVTRWLRGRRERARHCARDAVLCDARFGAHASYRGIRWYRVEFELSGQHLFVRIPVPVSLKEETYEPTHVLAHRDYPFALGFDTRGRPVRARVHTR
jgi:hypothetical protein